MKGFAFLEALVAVLIFSLITVAVGMTVVAGKNSLFTSDTPTQLRQNLLFSIMSISRDLRETAPSRINLAEGSSSDSVSFRVPFDNNGDGMAVDDAGNIEWSENISYFINGQSQLVRYQNAVITVIAPNISGIQFSRPIGQSRLIQVDINAQRNDNSGNWQDSEQVIIKMRN